MTLYLDNFHPSGEPILLQRLRCSPLAVYTYSQDPSFSIGKKPTQNGREPFELNFNLGLDKSTKLY
jgi:hypothetical protein